MSETNTPGQDAVQSTQRNRSNLAQSALNARRLAPWAFGLLLAVIVGIFWFTGGRHEEKPQSASLSVPQLPVPAGGENNSAVMDKTTRDADRAAAEKARREHSSYASPIQGNSASGAGGGELGDTPMDGAKGEKAQDEPHTDNPAPTPSTPRPGSAPGKPVSPDPGASAARKTEDPAPGFTVEGGSSQRPPPRPGSLSDAQKSALFALWSGHPTRLEVTPTGDGAGAGGSASNTTKTGFATQEAESAGEARGGTVQTASASTVQQAVRKKVLLRGGRGIYGHAVLTVNSDLGSDVVLEADSGPFAGARMTGTFTMQSDLLVIKITKLMIGDDPPIAVNAFVVAPGTGESGVATEVDEHLITRVFLPAAAAFVQGLGTALQNNNTQSFTAGLGLTSFTHYTLPQQLGVAGGAVGQSLGQFLQKQTPQKATAKLAEGAAVGIVFLDPVYAS